MTTLLNKCHSLRSKCPCLFTDRPDLDEGISTVYSGWLSLFQPQYAKYTIAKTVPKFLEKYQIILTCVSTWEFSKAPWLLETPSKEEQTMLDFIAQAAAQFPTWLNVMVKVKAEMSWAEDKQNDQATFCISELKSVEDS